MTTPASPIWASDGAAGYDLAANPIGRYSRGSLDAEMGRDKDGGLSLYLSAEPPARARQGNWLPVPRGPFNLFLRAYPPGAALQRRDHVPPAVEVMP